MPPDCLPPLNQENIAEVNWKNLTLNSYSCEGNMIACSVHGDVQRDFSLSNSFSAARILATRFIIPRRLFSNNKAFAFVFHHDFLRRIFVQHWDQGSAGQIFFVKEIKFVFTFAQFSKKAKLEHHARGSGGTHRVCIAMLNFLG